MTFQWERQVTPTWSTNHKGSLVATVGATGCPEDVVAKMRIGEERQLKGYSGKIYSIKRLS